MFANIEFIPSVVQVVAMDNFEAYAYFTDGSVRLFDVKPLISDGTVFEPLRDISVFKNKLAVINDTVAWDFLGNRDPYKCIDLDPFVIFEMPAVDAPFADSETA